VAKTLGSPRGRFLITGPSGSGKSTLCRFFRERGVKAVDGDDIRGLGGPVDLRGRPLRTITNSQWRRVEGWRFNWNATVLKRFLARRPNVMLFGASDNMFELDLAQLFNHRFYLQTTWPVIRSRMNDPARENDWGRDAQPAQREWVRKTTREWPVRAKESGFEFINASLTPEQIYRKVCGPRV
jgi:adenylate kinase family enzyme